ncbi:MAG: Na(+)-translocating NADH-quinone reductase subunit C [Gammaproteobacteria bacterium]|nr:Na(+)-translocating NADH-quinone reductase subunit C [Gammaproteobacteria bacterium]
MVAVALSIVCSVLVSGTAVLLRPLQLDNEKQNRQRIILEVAGLLDNSGQDASGKEQSLEQLFSQIEAHVVELASGEYVDTLDPATFDAQAASRDPELAVEIPAARDIANIVQRAKYATVYMVRGESGLNTLILPVYGYGLWSTMYGFLAFEGDANTIKGLRFYQQAETPGLGGEVDNPRWRAQWQGKLAFGPDGEPKIEVIRGVVDDRAGAGDGTSAARYQVDGLAGSTLTGRGVTNLMHYWLGDEGFGPYLTRLKATGEVQ